MMCDECGMRPANIHLTTIVGGEKKELNLCGECLMKSQRLKVDFSALAGQLAGLLSGAKSEKQSERQAEEAPESDVKCGKCGMSFETFRKLGQLGCAACYDEFREQITAILGRESAGAQHIGRAPGGADGEQSARIKIERLKQELNKAIAAEEYERAAALRDEVRTLKEKLEGERGDE